MHLFVIAILVICFNFSIAWRRGTRSNHEYATRIGQLPKVPCPCENPALCQPIAGPPVREKEVFGFGQPTNINFNWTHMTSVAWINDANFTCLAHSHNVRVILGTPPIILTPNISARAEFIDTVLQQVQDSFADGITFDYESPMAAGSAEGVWFTGIIRPSFVNFFGITTFKINIRGCIIYCDYENPSFFFLLPQLLLRKHVLLFIK